MQERRIYGERLMSRLRSNESWSRNSQRVVNDVDPRPGFSLIGFDLLNGPLAEAA